MKWNNVFKKSLLSKVFLINLLILVGIVGVQLLFQVFYFESYYLNEKEQDLTRNIEEFESFLMTETSTKEAITFLKEVKEKDNVVLSYRDQSLNNGIGLQPYMGNTTITLENDIEALDYQLVVGEQFEKVEFNKGDYVQAVGYIDMYGYLHVNRIVVNGEELNSYYIETTPILPSQSVEMAPLEDTVLNGQLIYIEGQIETATKEDASYRALAGADTYLSFDEKYKILTNETYNSRVTHEFSTEEFLLSSHKFGNGYIIAMTPLVEVNEMLSTLNNYYGVVFIMAFVFVSLASLLYSKYLTKPLIEMSYVAKKIASSKFQYKYDVKSEDELGELGHSLNQISENLEKSLSELQTTNELLRDEMTVQKKQEEKRKELISNISHELKTPITIIRGNIEGIQAGIYPPQMYENILEETTKLNHLVQEMLEMSQLESPMFKLNETIFELGSLILKENDKLRPIINEKHLTVEVELDDEIVVEGDELRINQVITNLLTNAIKYTPDSGKITITVSEVQNQEAYLCEIKNDGVSLTEEEQKQVWDSFYRTEKSRNKKYGGTGLGLSIVKRILELHQSDYGVKSDQESVTFYFTIKRCMDY